MPTPLFPRIALPTMDCQAAIDAIPEEWWVEHMIHGTYASGRAKIEVCWDSEGFPFLLDACGNSASLPAEWVGPADGKDGDA